MPKWLDRLLPHISIEGAEFFRERDRRGEPGEPGSGSGSGSGSQSESDRDREERQVAGVTAS
jgi:hypothetical protein